MKKKGQHPKYIYTLAEAKGLLLENPQIKFSQSIVGEELHLKISATKFAKNVLVKTDATNAKFSDNYFDLEPHEIKKIIIRNAGLISQIKIMSLFDCFYTNSTSK